MNTAKYYRAFKPNGEFKEGVNKIIFNEDGEEITREYVPEGLPDGDFGWASLAEINKHGEVYPFIKNRKLLTKETI